MKWSGTTLHTGIRVTGVMLVVFSPEFCCRVELNEVAALEYLGNIQCLLQCIGNKEGIKG